MRKFIPPLKGRVFFSRIDKIVSISSSMMTHWFNLYWHDCWFEKNINLMTKNEETFDQRPAYFDSRCFNIPREEIPNYVLFRYRNWERNSLSMYCRSFFSHKELYKKTKQDMHEMLHQIGKNWTTDLNSQLKNGTFLYKNEKGEIVQDSDVVVKYNEFDEFLKKLGV